MKYKFVMDTTKPMPLCGTKIENRDGALITVYKDFVFRCGNVVDCEDFNMISWVDLGIIREVECETVSSVVENMTVDTNDGIVEDDIINVLQGKEHIDCDTQTSTGSLLFTDGELVVAPMIDAEDKADNNEVTENDSDNDTNVSTNGYYPTDDGLFRCAYCNKLFKAEKSAILHVDRYHKE